MLTVAVLPFEDHSITHSPETLGLARTVADRITEKLAGASGISLVDRDSIEKLLDELSLSSQGLTQAEGRLQLGKLLGAHYLLMGEFSEVVGTLRLDARVVEVQTGTIVSSNSVDGAVSKRQVLERDFARKTAALLLKKAGGGHSRPPESSEDYLRLGRRYEQAHKTDQALTAYQKALALDPENREARDRMEILLMMAVE
ncbi:MAG: CsgG/HfaB family protein [Nitrospiria bacterium]